MTIKRSECGQPMEVEEKKPKLALRRPGCIPSGEKTTDNALVKGVRDRLRAESRRKFWQAFRTKGGNLVSIVILLAVLFVGWKIYRHFMGEKLSGNAGRLLDGVAESVKPSERGEAGLSTRARQKSDELIETVKEELNKCTAGNAPDYNRVRGRFNRAEVSYWGKLKPAERPGASAAVFSLLVPFGNTIARLYEVVSSPTGIVSVVQYEESGISKPVAQAEYEALVTEHGGFFACDGVAYYVSAKKNPRTWTAPLKSGEVFEPGKSYFGSAEPFIGKCRMNSAAVSFEVMWSLSEAAESVKVCDARMSEKVYFSQFKRAVEPTVRELREKTMGKKPKMKMYRPTVVFHDGDKILTGVGGIRKVPRRSTLYTGSGYGQWIKLRDEAYRQQSRAQEVEAENRRLMAEWENRIKAPVTDDEASRVLAAGNLRLKRK